MRASSQSDSSTLFAVHILLRVHESCLNPGTHTRVMLDALAVHQISQSRLDLAVDVE